MKAEASLGGLSLGETIFRDQKGYIPVYLPDRTLAGQARISDDGTHIEIEVPSGSPIAELMGDNLLGLSISYLDNEARDRVEEHNKKENNVDES